MQRAFLYHKRIYFFSILCFLFSSSALANYHPVMSIAAGSDLVGFNVNQNITFISPYQNNYYANNHKFDFVGGIFLGLQSTLPSQLESQIGISYYANTNYQVQGIINQFDDPTFDTIKYQYNIQSQRISLEGKLLTTCNEKYHPFITAGIGESINKAYQYTEIPLTSASVAMPSGFADHTVHSLTFQVGVGMEMDVATHVRIGGMYRYVGLGRARLGTSSLQEDNETLQNDSLNANELLFQISYIG